jgi:hypothetical protein
MGEKIYEGEKGGKNNLEYMVVGTVDRDKAEAKGICHFTTIIVPFITDTNPDSEDKGKWIFHDRTPKLWAKKKTPQYKKSFNLIGGHIQAVDESLIGKAMKSKTLVEGALDELSSELLIEDISSDFDDIKVEIWDKDGKNGTLNARKYFSRQLIPVGYTEYDSENNKEFSYVFALPVPIEDYGELICADDYIDVDNEHRNVKLKKKLATEEVLYAIYQEQQRIIAANKEPEIEICDAITRLWDDKNATNKKTLAKLRSIINNNHYMSKDEREIVDAKKMLFSRNYDSSCEFYRWIMLKTADEMDRTTDPSVVAAKYIPTLEDHYCEEHVDNNCVCRICGQVQHNVVNNDDGTFAMSGKIVTAYCKRCRKTWRYYADTGTEV